MISRSALQFQWLPSSSSASFGRGGQKYSARRRKTEEITVGVEAPETVDSWFPIEFIVRKTLKVDSSRVPLLLTYVYAGWIEPVSLNPFT